MSHSWRATGNFPYSRSFTTEAANRQVFVCDNCGEKTMALEPPDDDMKIPYFVPDNEMWYCTCEQLILLKVMDT